MASSGWLIDTDVLVDYLRGISQAIKFLERTIPNSLCYISAITMAELYAGVRDGEERKILDSFLQNFQIALINETIAKQGGLYKRDFGKSHGVGLADAVIAASADHFNLKIATLNKKHYPMIKNIHAPYQKN